MSGQRLAVQLMIVQAVLFAAETVAVHQIGSRISVIQLVLLRSAGGVVLALALGRKAILELLRTRQLRLQVLRGLTSLFYLWVMMYSFAHLPFADATAISYTQTAYIVVFSAIILHEPVTGARSAVAFIGMFGALLIAKPAFMDWNVVYVIALLGTGLNGLSFVLNRYLQRDDSQETTLFYSNLIPFIGNAPAYLFLSIPFGFAPFLWLPGILLFGPLGMFAGIVALRHANASTLGPYTLLRLVIALGVGVIAFREIPDIFSAVGAALIVVSCTLSVGKLPEIRHALSNLGVSVLLQWRTRSRRIAA